MLVYRYHNKNQYQTKLLKYIHSDKNSKFKISRINLKYLYIFRNSNNREIEINLAYLPAFNYFTMLPEL